MSVEDDYIEYIANERSGFAGGIEDEGLRHLDDLGLVSKSGLPSTLTNGRSYGQNENASKTRLPSRRRHRSRRPDR